MSVITKGKTFANGEQLTAGKLNQMLDAAVFSSTAVDNTKTTLSGGAITIAPNAITSTEIAQSFLDKIYPIGSIYTNATDGTNPGTLLGFGTWTAFGAGRVPVGVGSGTDSRAETVAFSAGATSGEYNHLLTQAEMNHNHIWATTGGSGADLSIALTTNGNRNDTFDGNGDSRELTSDGALSGTNHTDNNRALDSTSVTAHNNLQPYIVVYMWKRTA
jgi:hypothetical protein